MKSLKSGLREGALRRGRLPLPGVRRGPASSSSSGAATVVGSAAAGGGAAARGRRRGLDLDLLDSQLGERLEAHAEGGRLVVALLDQARQPLLHVGAARLDLLDLLQDRDGLGREAVAGELVGRPDQDRDRLRSPCPCRTSTSASWMLSRRSRLPARNWAMSRSTALPYFRRAIEVGDARGLLAPAEPGEDHRCEPSDARPAVSRLAGDFAGA